MARLEAASVFVFMELIPNSLDLWRLNMWSAKSSNSILPYHLIGSQHKESSIESTNLAATEKLGSLATRLAANIRARRTALGLTQAAVAEALDLDTETLSRFERGRHLPSLKTLERLAAVLQSRVATLLSEDEIVAMPESLRVSAWLGGLDQRDQAFVLNQIMILTDHLRAKAKSKK